MRNNTTRPDIDKLTRAVLDALTGVVYSDDCQVIIVHAAKCYADLEGEECAQIAFKINPQQ